MYSFLGIYYIFGVPLSIFLTFYTTLEFLGAWYSYCVVGYSIISIFAWKICNIDWDFKVNEIKKKLLTEEIEMMTYHSPPSKTKKDQSLSKNILHF